ncbi:hypothetical protein N7493_009608 [Penicillium malachiteum]|uniref:Uncharacterized protein n=1 Tax=Penicillium malachiteum TaxID=1324776 RepID=A0AAD6MSJ9_9EURO|nr:hypothetical protein N7493_009608 [Penicillium malachiteum]
MIVLLAAPLSVHALGGLLSPGISAADKNYVRFLVYQQMIILQFQFCTNRFANFFYARGQCSLWI